MYTKLFITAFVFFLISCIFFFASSLFSQPSTLLMPISGKKTVTAINNQVIAMHTEYYFDPTSTPTPLPTATPTPSPRPTRTPTPTPLPITSEWLEGMFTKYSNEYQVDKELLKRIANCESHFNTGAANGPYGGMFQFTESSWLATRISMGQDTNPDLRFSAEESIKTAAYKISQGGSSAWPGCSR